MTQTTHIQFTLFNSRDTLTKRIFKRDDGTIGKESAALARGTAQRVDVHGAQGLAHLLDNLAPTQAVAYGVTERLSASIGPRNYLRPGEISRSRDNFAWPAGAGVLFLDFDGKHDADSIPTLRQALASAMPELDAAPQVWTRSSSAAIFDPATGETSHGGLHCYVIVADAGAIPTIGRQLYDALWMNGHGYHELSRGDNPAALERCLVDASVWQPERLDYAAAPLVEAPLSRTAPTVIKVANADASPLDPARIKALSDDQQAAVNAAKRASKSKALKSVSKARAALLEALPQEERQQQRQRWLAMDRQTLTPDAPIILGNGHTITAAEILANPTQYNGTHCRDPQDPFNENGNDSQGLIYADDKGCRIFSLAHGGRTFRIAAESPQEARQAAPETLALVPEPDTRDIISACYRHAVEALPGGFEAVAAEMGITVSATRNTWRTHLAKRYRDLHSAAPANASFNSLQAIAAYLQGSERSAMLKAKLGSGKSQLAASMARTVIDHGGMLVSATLLSALARCNADAMQSAFYRNDRHTLASARVVSTTMHSMTAPRMSEFLEQLRQHRGTVVIDEAAMTAALLLQSGSIMDDAQRHATLRVLFLLRDAGCRFVLLDGDVTPALALLCELLGAEIVECTADPYPAPPVTVLPAQHVAADSETGQQNVKSLPGHSDVIAALARGERVVIATDSAANAEILHRLYSDAVTKRLPKDMTDDERPASLLLTADNKDMPEQARYIGAPNTIAPEYQLVVHSPVLGAGFSVTSVAPAVFVFLTSTSLGAPSVWQLARRFRCASHINLVVAHHLCSPCGQHSTLDDVERDLQDHAELLNLPRRSIGTAGMAACEYARALHLSNPLHALIGHLENIGARYSVEHDADTTGVSAKQEVRDLVETERTEVTRTAPREPLGFAQERCNNTPEDAAILRRAEVEDVLRIESDDLEPDGSLPYDLTYNALFDDLLSCTQRQAELLARRAGVDLDREIDAPELGFSGYKHLNEQCDIVLTMLDIIGNELCSINALAAFDAVASRVRVAHTYLTKPPRKRDGDQKKVNWVRATLERFGYEFGKADKRRFKGKETRFYAVKIDADVERFSPRNAAHRFPKIRDIGEHGKGGLTFCFESKKSKPKGVALAPYIYTDQVPHLEHAEMPAKSPRSNAANGDAPQC